MSERPRFDITKLLEHLRSPECWADEDAAADQIERLMAENTKLRKQRDAARSLVTHYVHVRSKHPQVAGEVWRELCRTIDEWEEMSDEGHEV